jgi:hypothetical protein
MYATVFSRVHFKTHLMTDVPIASINVANPVGWSGRCSSLELENHKAHISIPAFRVVKENGIVMFTQLPHMSHKLQPSDCIAFGPRVLITLLTKGFSITDSSPR